MKIVNGFKDFILRGNVIDLAVAVVIGAAFSGIIKSIVDNLITPLIAAIGGAPDTSQLWIVELNNAEFRFGAIIAAIINFVVIAAAVYFVIVLPVNKLLALRKRGEVAEPKAPSEDVLLLTEIRDLLARQTGGTTPTLNTRD
ncbi:large conductance mechanosensitive channel protein MscL [Kineococcus sp. NBC_00420]|uniref:large conductance mechanosensitive channel protein MscL n=1 Tax=Kineococcus sp. NBC_00420 TaxID=2903564 RepID=UPI002E1BB19B